MRFEITVWQPGRTQLDQRTETWPDREALIASLARQAERHGCNLRHHSADEIDPEQWIAYYQAGPRAGHSAYVYEIRATGAR